MPFGPSGMYPAYPAPSETAVRHYDAMLAFMREEVLPAEAAYERHRHEAGEGDHSVPPVIEELKAKARERGLWNLFLPSESGLTQLEYAPIAELSGWSNELAPEAINCQAPDTGNMELLHLIGTPEQQSEWLEPLLAGEIRSAFAMTEPRVASLRRDQHRDPHRARRRRVRHQRPQVVDLRCRRPALRGADRDGQDRPRGRHPPPAVDGHRADRHPRRRRPALAAGLRPPGPARPLRGRAHRRARAGRPTSSARRAAGSRPRRPASAPAASTT